MSRNPKIVLIAKNNDISYHAYYSTKNILLKIVNIDLKLNNHFSYKSFIYIKCNSILNSSMHKNI